jgi:hypothetical protein
MLVLSQYHIFESYKINIYSVERDYCIHCYAFRVKLKCAHSPLNLRILSLKRCPMYTYDGVSAKFSTKSHETDYSALGKNKSQSAYAFDIYFT